MKELVIFALPIMLGQLGLMLIGAGDMLIASRHSEITLAAIGIAVAIINPIMMIGIGLFMSISPLIAQKRGEGHDEAKWLKTILSMSLLFSIPFFLLTLGSQVIVNYLGYDEHINVLVKDYIFISAFSMPAVFIFTGLKEFTQAQEKTFIPNLISILAVFLNILLNIVLVFGWKSIPELGVNGLAYASLTVRMVMALSLLIFLFPFLRKEDKWLDKELVIQVIKLGTPLAIAIFLEVMAFCSVTLFMGKLGTTPTAAHNIILTIASITFMIPLAISSSVGVKVGFYYGEKNYLFVRLFAYASLFLSIGYMGISALILSIFPQTVLAPFGTSVEVFSIAKQMLFYAALFQLFDGAQVTLAGILRGLGITKITTFVSLFAYWFIGIPLGYYLANNTELKAVGYWFGLCLALFLVSIILGLYTRYVLKKRLV
jgi:MATE family multidrug resistance protein